MKLGTTAFIAAMAAAMALVAGITPAEAGKKNRAHQEWSQHGNVRIESHISSKHLKSLEKQLHGVNKQAVSEELRHRQLSYEKRSREQYAKDLGAALAGAHTGEKHILNLLEAGTYFGTRHKNGH